MTPHHYMVVVSPGPLMILRVPWPMPRWRGILKASTAVMRSHGMRGKDIHSLDGLVPYPDDRTPEDVELVARVAAGFAGASDKVPRFWLYDWQQDAFRLARAPTEIS